LLIPVCSAIRLAKFNIDLRQTENFTGLPTPANALFFASIPLILLYQKQTMTIINMDFLTAFLSNTRVLAILTVLFSYLLISEFRMFSMKFKHMRWKGNEPRYLLIIISILCLAFCSLSAVPLIVTAYFLLSLIWQKQLTE
jgi:CDP-diacylglycerol--serine O-phosphatidyltransferase